MSAILIISENPDRRKSEGLKALEAIDVKVGHPDLLLIEEEEKIGVEDTKKVREFLSMKPYQSRGRGVLILNAQNLTIDAQNSLLKTLEEPPIHSLIVLLSDSEHSLLPTIISRCRLIRVDGEGNADIDEKNLKILGSLEGMDIAKRFEIIEKIEDKESFLRQLIIFYRKQLKEREKIDIEFLKELLEAEKWSKSNVNIRAILEYLMLSL